MIDVVCGVIQDSDGRYLACLRPQGKLLGGMWEFPGGKVDPGESAETALARELVEELGVVVEVGKALDPVEWTYDWGCIRLLPFLCRIVAEKPEAIEHERLHWCPPSDFDELNWAAADVPILDQIRNLISETAN